MTRREQLRAIRRRLADLMDAGELMPGIDYPQPHGIGPADAWCHAACLLLLAEGLGREHARRGEPWWRVRADFVARELERFAAWWDGRMIRAGGGLEQAAAEEGEPAISGENCPDVPGVGTAAEGHCAPNLRGA